MTTRHAQCSCGQLRVTTTVEPFRVARCHCVECQRRTGAPFGVSAAFLREGVTITGASTTWERGSDAGFRITSHFCPTCGSTVFWFNTRRPDGISIAVGGFADPSFVPPMAEVYVELKHGWVPPLEHVPHE